MCVYVYACMHTEGKPREDTARRLPSANQEERFLTSNLICQHLDLGFLDIPASRTTRTRFLWLKPICGLCCRPQLVTQCTCEPGQAVSVL